MGAGDRQPGKRPPSLAPNPYPPATEPCNLCPWFHRVNHLRTEQFQETGADTVVVFCPFCLQMFEEGVGSVEGAQNTRAGDLIEILDESLGPAG